MKLKLCGKYLYMTIHGQWMCLGLASKQETWNYFNTLVIDDSTAKLTLAIMMFNQKYPDSGYKPLMRAMRYDSKARTERDEKHRKRILDKLTPELRRYVK